MKYMVEFTPQAEKDLFVYWQTYGHYQCLFNIQAYPMWRTAL